MVIRFTIAVVLAVVALSIGSALFRVATAPDRIAERRAMAREVCVKSGGEWVRHGREELCKRS
jgi:hypothetical protein